MHVGHGVNPLQRLKLALGIDMDLNKNFMSEGIKGIGTRKKKRETEDLE
jgi:hypothetical protein